MINKGSDIYGFDINTYAIAKKVNKILKEDEKPFLLGSIAPDVAKIVGIDRGKTHFVEYATIYCLDEIKKDGIRYLK